MSIGCSDSLPLAILSALYWQTQSNQEAKQGKRPSRNVNHCSQQINLPEAGVTLLQWRWVCFLVTLMYSDCRKRSLTFSGMWIATIK